MKKSLVACCLCALIVFVLINGNHALCIEEEGTALLTLKASFLSTGDDSFKTDHLSDWVGNEVSNCCNWERVICDPITNHVTGLSLHSLRYRYEFWSLNLTLFCPFRNLKSLDLSADYFVSIAKNVHGNKMLISFFFSDY